MLNRNVHPYFSTTFLFTSVLALMAPLCAAAQFPSVVPVPFVTAYAGLPAGGSGALCTTDIPNTTGAHLGDGCLPTQATLVGVYGAFTDSIGNVYITENGTDNDIRVVYKGGAALTAMLTASNVTLQNFTPQQGHIYTLAGARSSSLSSHSTGPKYTCDGTPTGPQALDSSGDGCPATQAYLKPRGVAVDADGDVYMVTTSNGNTVKVIYGGGARTAALITTENPGVTPQIGYVYLLSGQSTASYSGDGALAKNAALIVVRNVAVDRYGNVFISDGTTPTTVNNVTSTVAGNNVRVIYAGVQAPAGMSGLTNGYIYTYAGGAGCTPSTSTTSCPAGYSGDGGPATKALFNSPYTLVLDRYNNLFIADYTNDRLRVVYSGGTIPGISNPMPGYVYTYAGGGGSTASGTIANQVAFGVVQTAGVDGAGNMYVEDSTAKVIWKFDAITGAGFVTAGTGTAAKSPQYCSGAAGPQSTDNYGDGCPATQATFSDIGPISFDPQGNGYVGENGNAIVRELSFNAQFPATAVGSSASQYLAYVALSGVTLNSESFSLQGGTTTEFSDNGSGTCTGTSVLVANQTCSFGITFQPQQSGLRQGTQTLSATNALASTFLSGLGTGATLAIDPGTQSSVGQGFSPAGVAADLLGNVYFSGAAGIVYKGSASGASLTALVTGLNYPGELAVDAAGNLYIADRGNNRILETDSGGHTIATYGTGLNGPGGIAVNSVGTLLVADTGNNRIVSIAQNGVQTVVPIAGLSAPTQLNFDTNGNLFVVDSGNARVVELAAASGQLTVSLPSGITPSGIAVDGAGTIYVADAASHQVQSFPPGSATGNALVSGLSQAATVATDNFGDVFVADSGATSGISLLRINGNVVFPITNVNSSSTASINLTNTGNASLSFPSSTLYTLTGSNAFSLAPASVQACATGVNYNAGADCSFTATFKPTARGTATANVTFNTNATNTSTAKATLTASGQQLITTTTSIAITSPTGAIYYNQNVVLTATTVLGSNSGTPTGTVTFTVNGKVQAPQPFGNGTVTLTLTPGVGTYAVSVAFSGDTTYASSSNSLNFSVNQAKTFTTLAVTPQSANGTLQLAFTATVSSQTATGETGTVNFYAGSTFIGTANVGANGVATYNSASLGYAVNIFTAVYSGDPNFMGSTSAIDTPVSDFAISTTTTSISVPQGGVGTVNYVISPIYNSTGNITPACSGLPANTVCRFQPTTIALSGLTNFQLEIYTNVSTTYSAGFSLKWAALFAGMTTLLLLMGRRRLRPRVLAIALSFSFAAVASLTGCGSGSSAAKADNGLVTPAGSSTVTVTFAGASPLGSHTSRFQLIVLTNNTSF